ncbi:IS1182 family transposase [Pseudomonas sp. FH4]|uniref:transposase n=1 Tax=Pseudomonas fluorescens group TaxID=136843 RepID=UPI0003DDC3BB|nr:MULTISPECIES: transposase [Pseudomonas fluorescens group]ETK19163.1 IS1182 family transposase [Pseudomonas sp. FH4]MBF8006536.1 transposase [Pseudomonas brenneri]
MMGQLSSGQDRLFYSFNLEDHIPANHLLRSIDRCLDLSDLRHYLADFYSPIGRPSIDPELMIRMLIVGYCYGIRSERRLCEEAHLNLAYRWFCRLSLEDEVPNHSTFSKNRHGRFRDSDLFRWLFNEVLRRCMGAGLVKGEGFAVDASIIKADASWQRGVPGDEPVNWSDPALSTRAVREYLEALDEEAEEYRCPAGNVLRSEWRAFKNERSNVTKASTIIFRSRQTDCANCPMKAKCCPNTTFRKIARSVHEAARDVARRIAATPEYVRSRHERKKVEMLFAHLKRILKLDRLRLRGMSGATDEFTLAAAVQNLRRLAKFTSQGPPVTG